MNSFNHRAPPSATISQKTLKSGTRTVPYIAMTSQAILCPAPVLAGDLDNCQIPGGSSLWATGGFYSPGVCFIGYEALCTQTDPKQLAWSIRSGETVVRCVPSGYECNDSKDPRYAISSYGTTILSAPAFEIRWRSQDLQQPTGPLPPPGVQTSPPSGKTSSTLPLTSKASVPPTAPQASASSAILTTTPATNIKLSAGAIVGMIIGALMSVCFLVLAVMVWRRRFAQRRTVNEDFEPATFAKNASERDDEMEPHGPMELSAEAKAVELSASKMQNVSSSAWGASHISVNKIPVEMA